MTLLPQEALKLQSVLMSFLRQDGSIEIDARFLQPIFGGANNHQTEIESKAKAKINCQSWCKQWDIDVEFFTRAKMNDQQGKPIEWVGFSQKKEDEVLTLVDDDDL